jgi:hypothetical protein
MPGRCPRASGMARSASRGSPVHDARVRRARRYRDRRTRPRHVTVRRTVPRPTDESCQARGASAGTVFHAAAGRRRVRAPSADCRVPSASTAEWRAVPRAARRARDAWRAWRSTPKWGSSSSSTVCGTSSASTCPARSTCGLATRERRPVAPTRPRAQEVLPAEQEEDGSGDLREFLVRAQCEAVVMQQGASAQPGGSRVGAVLVRVTEGECPGAGEGAHQRDVRAGPHTNEWRHRPRCRHPREHEEAHGRVRPGPAAGRHAIALPTRHVEGDTTA